MKSISSKKRYAEKLKLVDGIDPYEVTKVIGKSHRLVASNHATSGVYVPHPSSESLLRKGFPQLQKPGLLPEFCSRLGEASARETRS